MVRRETVGLEAAEMVAVDLEAVARVAVGLEVAEMERVDLVVAGVVMEKVWWAEVAMETVG